VKLNNKLSIALNKLRRLHDNEGRAFKAERLARVERDCILKARLSVLAWLLCFKKVHKKV